MGRFCNNRCCCVCTSSTLPCYIDLEMLMRLSDFIEATEKAIVGEAVAFARTIAVLAPEEEAVLVNHIPEMLRTISADLRSSQSTTTSIAKSHGMAAAAHHYTEADGHGKQRALAGLSIDQLLAEYRALRSSVLRLWAAHDSPGAEAIQDIGRFNEAIDQAIAESVRAYAKETESRRQLFLAALGHDLRSPLNAAALTAAALTHEAAKGAPPNASYMKVLGRSVARMAKLLESLLDYNLVGLGLAMTLRKSASDLAVECEEEIQILRAANPDATIDLVSEGDCSGQFDESRVREALGNLVSNAVRHGVASEPVRVSMRGNEFEVEISVTNAVDQPISAKELALLFEPLRRGAKKSPSGERTHLGLGLFITQEIAKAHGGHITPVSVDTSVCFRLVLPKGQQ